MNKRLLALLSLLVVASMMLAACGTPAATEAPATEAPATEAPATEAPATEAATESMGTIKIATQSPLSGGQSLLGVAIKQGAELALEQLSGDLVAMGYDVQLAPYDDQATPDVGVANAKNIVADADILCGVGHLNSGVMIPSSEEYHTANLPFVSPANTNPVVTTRGYLEVNRVVGRDDVQAPAAEEFAFTTLGAKSVYIIHDKTAYGQGVAEFFRAAAEEDGLEIVAFEGTEEQANFDAIVTPVVATQPDVVFFAGIYNQAGVFFKQARDAGYEGTFLGTDGMDSSDLADIAGDALTTGGGMYYTTVAGPAAAYPAAAQFAADYEAKFGSAPEAYAAQAYDSMNVCLTAIKAAAEAAGGKPSRLQVAEAVRQVSIEGLTGNIGFDDIGDLPTAQYFIIKVNAAAAADWATNEIQEVLEVASPGK
ncbi:MAG TPA: branched-chain amino acid ABC transporter substrate-binding protein [Anaerolineales bacterium]|nr:branched-chain amino acid ABC transporter substrate-binding protein [Anaerolineales bacterium]HNB35302.1 branched-chain amino acid ABC transporter substrate-binding protein [Anaerolineales bacterium]